MCEDFRPVPKLKYFGEVIICKTPALAIQHFNDQLNILVINLLVKRDTVVVFRELSVIYPYKKGSITCSGKFKQGQCQFDHVTRKLEKKAK